jgi:hypothetical protein
MRVHRIAPGFALEGVRVAVGILVLIFCVAAPRAGTRAADSIRDWDGEWFAPLPGEPLIWILTEFEGPDTFDWQQLCWVSMTDCEIGPQSCISPKAQEDRIGNAARLAVRTNGFRSTIFGGLPTIVEGVLRRRISDETTFAWWSYCYRGEVEAEFAARGEAEVRLRHMEGEAYAVTLTHWRSNFLEEHGLLSDDESPALLSAGVRKNVSNSFSFEVDVGRGHAHVRVSLPPVDGNTFDYDYFEIGSLSPTRFCSSFLTFGALSDVDAKLHGESPFWLISYFGSSKIASYVWTHLHLRLPLSSCPPGS